jgi:hypothetical protein
MKKSALLLAVALAAVITAGCDSTPTPTTEQPAPVAAPTTPVQGKGGVVKKQKEPPTANARVPKTRQDL